MVSRSEPRTETATPAAGALGEESFEAVLSRLERIVQRLEKGELSLEESLRAYEEGVGLVRQAQGRLDGMDRRLEQLLADGRTAPLPSAPGGDDCEREA